MAKAIGRPTDYNEELAAKICSRIACGESLRKICQEDQMPSASSVFLWLTKHPSFSENYAKAQQERSEAMYEEMLDIGDDVMPDPAEVAKARLRVDTRKWALARMNPKKYGDKLETTLQGPNGGPIQSQSVVMGVKAEDVPEDVLRWMASNRVENTG